ncbi:hypothetical protein BS17DRAFT_697354, partial [Gyrodon lividus]
IVNADVYIGHGVLYNTGEYRHAEDCSKNFTALTCYDSRTLIPRGYLLWNPLGSSLSNAIGPRGSGAYTQKFQSSCDVHVRYTTFASGLSCHILRDGSLMYRPKHRTKKPRNI